GDPAARTRARATRRTSNRAYSKRRSESASAPPDARDDGCRRRGHVIRRLWLLRRNVQHVIETAGHPDVRCPSEIAAQVRDRLEPRAVGRAGAGCNGGIHDLVQPLIEAAAEKEHFLITERSEENPGLGGVRTALGVEDDGFVSTKHRRR